MKIIHSSSPTKGSDSGGDVGGASPSSGSSMHAKVGNTSGPGPFQSASLLHGHGHGGPACEPACFNCGDEAPSETSSRLLLLRLASPTCHHGSGQECCAFLVFDSCGHRYASALISIGLPLCLQILSGSILVQGVQHAWLLTCRTNQFCLIMQNLCNVHITQRPQKIFRSQAEFQISKFRLITKLMNPICQIPVLSFVYQSMIQNLTI